MESLKLSFEAVMPIFLLMLLGYLLRTFKVADKKAFDTMNRLVFKVFLPVLLFNNIYKTDASEIIRPQLVLFVVLGMLAVFVIGYILIFRITPENSRRGVTLQTFFRSNYAILGIPLVDFICDGKATGLASLMVAVVVPLINVLAVITLERFRGTGEKTGMKALLLGIIKNPLISGCVLGLLFFITGWKLPFVVERAVGDVSKIASPLAIIALGASFTFSSIRGYVKEIVIIVISRLVIVPLLALPLACYLGFGSEEIACLLIIFGGPVAVSSFSMAQQMGGDEHLAAHAVVFTSACCLLTLFVWIYALSALGVF